MSKFDIALYKNNGKIIRVHANQIDHESYLKTYRGRLYCPNGKCSARLSFVERETSQTVFFKTWNGDNHVDGCNYSVLYDEENYSNRNYDFVNLNISDEHIKNRLETAFNSVTPGAKPPTTPTDDITTEIIDNVDGGIVGKPSLFGEGEEVGFGREPRIEKRFYELLSDEDNGQVRCVIGNIHSIHINEEHAYINLTPLEYEAVSVYLNPSFKETNAGMFDGLEFLNSYLKTMKRHGRDVLICCVGLVELRAHDEVAWKYQISIDRAIAMTFNGKSYYELLNESTRRQL